MSCNIIVHACMKNIRESYFDGIIYEKVPERMLRQVEKFSTELLHFATACISHWKFFHALKKSQHYLTIYMVDLAEKWMEGENYRQLILCSIVVCSPRKINTCTYTWHQVVTNVWTIIDSFVYTQGKFLPLHLPLSTFNKFLTAIIMYIHTNVVWAQKRMMIPEKFLCSIRLH